MSDDYPATVAAGSLRLTGGTVTTMPHRWTAEGVTLRTDFTGGHLLHLAVAGCVLNDLYREARTLGVRLAGVRVHARGGFDEATWASTGITYEVELDAPDASAEQRQELLETVDEVAEVPKAVRQGAAVLRAG